MSESAPQNKQQQRTERSTNALLQAASELIVEGGFVIEHGIMRTRRRPGLGLVRRD